MTVKLKKIFNKEHGGRVEFLLINYDYIDGNDHIAKLFVDEYGFSIEKRIDGWWYKIIRLRLGDCQYELLWHEDFGNMIYCLTQTASENDLLQQRLDKILTILNARFENYR